MVTSRQIIADVYKKFVTEFIVNVHDMKTCEQGGSFLNPSPYHLEGDVWTHTVCCYSHLLNIFEKCNIISERDRKIVCLAVLFHDIGKPSSVGFHESGKKYFRGHDARSMQIIMRNHKLICEVFEISHDDLVDIMLIVQVHTLYYQLKNYIDIYKYLNYRMDLLSLYIALSTADAAGQIREDNNEDEKFDIIEAFSSDNKTLPIIENERFINNSRSLIIFCGCPASGKDTIIKTNYLNVEETFSFDDIRVEEYQKNYDTSELSYETIYNASFHWCNENKINLLEILQSKIKNAYESGKKVLAISNCNLTKKARKALLGFARNFKATPYAVYVMNDVEVLIKRDQERCSENKGKMVGDSVIYNMYNIQFLPTKEEGFKEITYIFN